MDNILCVSPLTLYLCSIAITALCHYVYLRHYQTLFTVKYDLMEMGP